MQDIIFIFHDVAGFFFPLESVNRNDRMSMPSLLIQVYTLISLIRIEALIHLTDAGNNIAIRNITSKDIPDIIELQKRSFPLMAKDGVIWNNHHLESHIRIFPEGQFCAEIEGKIIGSSSSLVISLTPDYQEHTWKQATAYGMFTNHTLNGDSLYGADISTHPDSRGLGVASMLYDARKDLAVKLNLRRMIAGGRLFNYCEYAEKMSAQEYAERVVKGELRDLVLSFQLNNGFKFIKILPNYMKDARSLNYASFIEWINPKYAPSKKGLDSRK